METLTQASLILHIASGMCALLAGLGGLIFKKGSSGHRLSGKVFYWSMIAVAMSALYLSIVRPNEFLMFIGLFTLFMTLSGQRAIRNKTSYPRILDIAILLLGLGTGIWMVFSDTMLLRIFGGFALFLGSGDLRDYYVVITNKNIFKNLWLLRHIRHMLGSYIAATTAFLVVNIEFSPAWVIWLFPTLALSPVIAYWSIKISPKSKTQFQ